MIANQLKSLQALIVDAIGLLHQGDSREPYPTVRFADNDRRYPILQEGLKARGYPLYYTNSFFPLHDALYIQDGQIVVSYVSYDENQTIITHPFIGFDVSSVYDRRVYLHKPIVKTIVGTPLRVLRTPKQMPERGVFDYTSIELSADVDKFREQLEVVHEMMKTDTVADVDPTGIVYWTPYIETSTYRYNTDIGDYTTSIDFYNAPFFRRRTPFYLLDKNIHYRITDYQVVEVRFEIDKDLFSVESTLHIYAKERVENFDRIRTISDALREN